jgi:hypothetical protein
VAQQLALLAAPLFGVAARVGAEQLLGLELEEVGGFGPEIALQFAPLLLTLKWRYKYKLF